jgi:DNA-binding NtrC family response regulator
MERTRILIVEDEPIVALGIGTSLGKMGYHVAGTAATGEQAIKAARELAPDVILMDIRLQGTMDGVSAAAEIRSSSGAPVVFLTAYADEQTLTRAKAASPFGYVQKPFQDKDLHLAIEMALLRSSLEKKLNVAIAEAEHQRAFFEAIFETNPNGILVVDAECRVRAANQAIERMLGLGADQLTGRHVGAVFRCAHAATGKGCGESPGCSDCRLLAAVTAALAGSQAFRNRTQMRLSVDGKGPRLELLVSARGIDFQNRKLAVVILEDVTELSALRRQTRRPDSFSGMIGRHPKMAEVFEAIRDVSRASAPVLVLGESGTGKELVARAIHDSSLRAGKPFVPVNCGALPESLLESELFGHVRGAFTGAIRDKKGRFELADGGTIFLDEIGDLTQVMQVKLLRVLQEGTIERVGGEKTLRVDVRVISATNKDLREEMAAGRFRDDLYYRLCVVPINLPPLRERGGDIPLLAAEFLKGYESRSGSGGHSLGPDALRLIEGYSWPGNVRELQNAIQYAVIKARGQVIGAQHLPPTLAAAVDAPQIHRRRPLLSRAAVEEALRETGGNRVKAAGRLGISRATLYRFLAGSGV